MTNDGYAALNGAAGLFCLGLGLLALTRWLYYRNTTCIQDGVHLLFVLIGQSLTLAAVAAWALRTMSGIGVLWLMQLAATLLFALGAQWRHGRRVELHAVLSATTARGLPLSEALSALALEWGGVRGQRLERTARLVQQGIPLSEAAAVARAGLSQRHLCWIGLGERTQTLPQALVAASEPLPDEDVVVRWQAVVTWLGCLLFFILTVAVASLTRILPEMAKLQEDFGLRVSPAHAGVAAAIENSVLVYLRLGAIPYFVLVGGLIAWIIYRFLGVSLLPLPRRWRPFRQREIAHALRSLAFVWANGQPLEPHLPWLAEHYPHAWIARRFTKAARAVERGEPVLSALHKCGLLNRAEAAFLDAAQAAGSLAWTARELADCIARRAAFRLQISLYVLCLPILLLFAAVVVLFAAIVWMPLVDFILRLT